MEGLLAQRYRLEAVIGSGGMGTVWRAHDELLDRPVAIKEVRYSARLTDQERADQTARAVAEARHAARLEHPRIVPIHDVLIHEGRPWIVMRFVSGRSLQQHVQANTRLPEAEVIRIARGLLEALAVAHQGGVQHRDVKPSNVLISDDGEPMLTDFSIAKAIGQGTMTSTDMVVGSPGYIAPERVINGTAGPEADLFGLGATLYFAAEGRAPFAHIDPMAGAFAAAIHPHPRPEHSGPELTALLDGLLEKDPRQRLTIAAAQELLGVPTHTPAAPRDTAPEARADVVLPVSPPVSTIEPARYPAGPQADDTPPLAARLTSTSDTLEDHSAKRGAVGRAVPRQAPPMSVPVDEEQVDLDFVRAGRRGQVALIAIAVVVVLGTVAATVKVIADAPKHDVAAAKSAEPAPSVTTPSAAPTQTTTPSTQASQTTSTAPVVSTKPPASSPFYSPELKTFGAGWQPGMYCESHHAQPARALDASGCALSPAPIPDLTNARSRWVTITLEQFAPGQADTNMGCTPEYTIPGMAVGKVDRPGTSGNRAGYYCETTGNFTSNDVVIGMCTDIMWTSGDNRMLGMLYNCFTFADEGSGFKPTPAMLDYLRGLWNARA